MAAKKIKTTIKQKITAFILLSFFIVGFLGLGLMYWWAYGLVDRTITRDYLLLGNQLSEALDRIITREIKSTQTLMSSSERLHKIEECNLKYAGMNAQAKEEYFKEMDKRWEQAADKDALIAEYTQSALGNRLKEIAGIDSSIAEIFITDKYGGLIAASDRISDFYQADEKWWQESFDNGKGRVFVDRAGIDASSGAFGVALAYPIRNKSKEVIGICKNILEINRLFQPLKDFHFGISGHVGLIDSSGYFLFHPGIQPMTRKLPAELMKKVTSRDSIALLTDKRDDLHSKALYYYFVKVNHPVLLQSGLEWWVAIAQDKDEIFAPLRQLVQGFILVAIIILALLVVSGFYFAKLLIRPIIKLRDAMIKAAKGDLESKVEIKTDDEIEELSEVFNSMLDKLKASFIAVNTLNQEIISRKKIEKAMRLSTERYRKLYTESIEAILTFSPEDGLLSGNPAAVKLFACRDEEELGMMKISDLSPERQADGIKSLDLIQQMILLALEKGVYKFEWVHRRLNGEDFKAEVVLSKFELEGKVLLQAIVRDIGEG